MHVSSSSVLPLDFVTLLKRDLGAATASRVVEGMGEEGTVSVRLNPDKPTAAFAGLRAVPWCPEGRLLPNRPEFITDPLWQAGAFYVQDAASMAVGQVAAHFLEGHETAVLDLCAAPGGKSTHLASVVPDGCLLVSNEVIKSRQGVLRENLMRWGKSGHAMSGLDPDLMANRLPGFFDMVVVDAPCSGEGMFRKDPASRDEWSSDLVELCAARQQRILLAAYDLLAPGGVLIYSTCTLNLLENELNALWIKEEGNMAFEAIPDALAPGAQPALKGVPGLRFMPGYTESEGLFLCVLRKPGINLGLPDGASPRRQRLVEPHKLVVKELAGWVDKGMRLFEHREQIRFLPEAVVVTAESLLALAPLINLGTPLATVNRKRPAEPEPALALSTALSPKAFPAQVLTAEEAVAYFRKDHLVLEGAPHGWTLLTYQGLGFGWAKILANGRVQNHWPGEWRIRKG
jgi:16S rRNA C967 or C1407 C5-methylase (RsmB/RsmF family)/NOL1/NOP2/fmu family ribosome biogenesis protein